MHLSHIFMINWTQLQLNLICIIQTLVDGITKARNILYDSSTIIQLVVYWSICGAWHLTRCELNQLALYNALHTLDAFRPFVVDHHLYPWSLVIVRRHTVFMYSRNNKRTEGKEKSQTLPKTPQIPCWHKWRYDILALGLIIIPSHSYQSHNIEPPPPTTSSPGSDIDAAVRHVLVWHLVMIVLRDMMININNLCCGW